MSRPPPRPGAEMTDLMQPDAVGDQDEVVKPRPYGPAKRHAPRRSAMIVAGSLVAGLVAAIALVAGPFAGGREAAITGAILLGFAVGWALLAVLSVRVTDRPKRWATVPAAAMAITGAGLIVLAPGAAALTALGWVWPPLLLALVVWMTVHSRRQPSSRLQPWLLYPVFGVVALAAIGGGSGQRDRPGPRTGRGLPTPRRRRASPEHPLHRLGQPDRCARTGTRRIRVGDGALDRPGRRAHDNSLRLRPRRSRSQRPRPRRRCRRGPRSARPADPRARPGPVRDRRPFARRRIRAQLRTALPSPGRRHRPARLHAPQPRQGLPRHQPDAGRRADAGADGPRAGDRRSEGRQADDAGEPARPGCRRDAGRAQPSRQAGQPRRPAPGRPDRRHGLRGVLGCRTKRPGQAVEHHRSPHRRRRDAPVAHRRQERRGSIEPRHRRRRHGGAEDTWLIPMRATASTRRLGPP